MALCRCYVRMDCVSNAAAVVLNVGVSNANNVKSEGIINAKVHFAINVESGDLIIVRRDLRLYANHAVQDVTNVWDLVAASATYVVLITVINLPVFSARHAASDVTIVWVQGALIVVCAERITVITIEVFSVKVAVMVAKIVGDQDVLGVTYMVKICARLVRDFIASHVVLAAIKDVQSAAHMNLITVAFMESYCKSCSQTKSSKIRLTPSILDSALGPILIRKMLAKGATGDYRFKETLNDFCSIPEVKSKIMQWQ